MRRPAVVEPCAGYRRLVVISSEDPQGRLLRFERFHLGARVALPPAPIGAMALTWVERRWGPTGQEASLSLHAAGQGVQAGPAAGQAPWSGVHLWIRLAPQERPAPACLNEAQIPSFSQPGFRVEVLAGSSEGLTSPLGLPEDLQLHFIHVERTSDNPTLPAGRVGLAYALGGEGRVAGQRLICGEALDLGPGPCSIAGDDLIEVLLAFSQA